MNLTLVVGLTVAIHLAFAGLRVTLSLFAIHLGASPITVGIIMSLLAVLPMLLSVHTGRAIDRIGVRRPMLVAAAILLSGLALVVARPGLATLFFASTLAGSGFMLWHIAANHAVGTLGRPETRARNFSLIALGFSTSGFLGPMLAGFAIDGIGHRHTFLLLCVFPVIAFVVLLARPGDVPRHESAPGTAARKRLADLFANRTLRRVFIVSGVLSMAWDLFTFVVPIHGSNIGLSASTIGLILGAFGAAIFAVRLALPLIAHRVDEWKLLIGAMLATGAALAVFPLVHGVPLLIALAFLLGIGLGGAQPMIMALLYNKAPAGRGGEAVGVRTLLLNFSQSGMPLIFGALGAALGMAPVFWAMALALLGAGYALRRS